MKIQDIKASLDLSEVTPAEDFLQFDKDVILNSFDPFKENIIYFGNHIRTCIDTNEFQHVNGFLCYTYKTLKEHFNVFYIGTENPKMGYTDAILISSSKLKRFVKKFCKKKVEYDGEGLEYIYYDHKMINDYVRARLDFIKNVKYITGIGPYGEWRLILQPYKVAGRFKYKWNEFFDYIGDDEKDLKDLGEIVQQTLDEYPRYCNPLAFMMIDAAVNYNLLHVLVENNKDTLVSVDNFSNDPAGFTMMFNALPVPNRNFYFVDDYRGTRTYQQYPIAELQHLVYDNMVLKKKNEFTDLFDEEKEEPEKHTKNFFFMGTILNVKGNRIGMWEKFLKDFNYPDSDFYIPPKKQGIIFKETSDELIKKKQKNFTDELVQVLNEIEAHPCYKGYLLPKEVNDAIDQYKYTFIMRCVSCCDSLNYRPVQYTYHRVLFFLDPMYDPCYLQIPKEIQDKLRVNNAQEIMVKIDYFEQHPEEREEILNYLWNYYSVDKWLEPGYAEKEILKYYP